MVVAETNSPTYFCEQQLSSQLLQFLGGCVGVYTARSPRKETPNEDAAAVIPFDENSGVLVVADGMGGQAAGEVASKIAIDEMVAAIIEARESNLLLRSAIINGFERANESVLANVPRSGTTLAVAEINDGWARTYHVGDSVVLIVSQRGNIKLETVSHSPVGLGLEAGFLNQQQADNYVNRHFLLNAIGTEDMRIEIGSRVKLAKRDTVLLASDGLTDNLSCQNVIDQIRKGPLESNLNRLAEKCAEQMVGGGWTAKPDDMTVVVYRPTGRCCK